MTVSLWLLGAIWLALAALAFAAHCATVRPAPVFAQRRRR